MTNGFTQVENDEIDRLVRDEGLSLNEAVACVSRNFGRFCPYSDCGKALSKPMEHHVWECHSCGRSSNSSRRTVDLRTMPVFGNESYQDVRHPFTNYSLGDAIALAINNAKTFGRKSPTSLREVRDYIAGLMQRTDHQWLTGYAALDVLDAAIDGKDIRQNHRFPQPQ